MHVVRIILLSIVVVTDFWLSTYIKVAQIALDTYDIAEKHSLVCWGFRFLLLLPVAEPDKKNWDGRQQKNSHTFICSSFFFFHS